MSGHPDLVVLVRTLEPSDELGSTLELLAWIHATRPELKVRLVALQGGAWSDRAAAVAQLRVTDEALAGRSARTLLTAGVAPVAQAARSAGLRRALRTGPTPVLVDASAGGLLNWLDPSAGRVVAHLTSGGPKRGDLPEQDRSALDRRATHWAEGMDLLPQGPDREDRTGVTARCRAQLDRELGIVPGAPLILLGAARHEVVPPDGLLALVWTLVGSHRGLRVLWATGPVDASARAAMQHRFADAGLHEVVIPVDASSNQWRLVAAADAAIVHADPRAACGLGSTAGQIASARTFTWKAGGTAGPDVDDDIPGHEAVSAVLPGGPAWTAPTEEWHAATGGPAWLQLLGIDLPSV